jgi:hypothetical protein
VFSVGSHPRLYNENKREKLLSCQLVACQPPFSEDVSTETEAIVGILYHATTNEDIAFVVVRSRAHKLLRAI